MMAGVNGIRHIIKGRHRVYGTLSFFSYVVYDRKTAPVVTKKEFRN